jgi:hypothetical protein
MTHDEMVDHLKTLGYEFPEITAIISSFKGYDATSIPVILAHFPVVDNGYPESVEFVGQDSCEYAWDNDIPCTGWDGYSRRCDCGNRRVYWAVDGDWAYGMAD